MASTTNQCHQGGFNDFMGNLRFIQSQPQGAVARISNIRWIIQHPTIDASRLALSAAKPNIAAIGLDGGIKGADGLS